MRGYCNYHGVPGNIAAMECFHRKVTHAWLHALRRRMPWQRFGNIASHWITQPRILHPYPNERFYVKHPKLEPYAVVPHVRICAGAVRKGGPYRDRNAVLYVHELLS